MNNIQILERTSWHFRPFKITACFIFLILGQFMHAQLSAFTLTVTPTNETCTANGSLSFTVTNTVPGASMIYTIFHLPDVTTPIAVISTTTFTGLAAGNYRVVATQSLGSQNFSQFQDVTIENNLELLVYTLTSVPEVCGNDAQISFVVTNGTAVSYEIFSGPAIRPLQPSNVFSNLPAGTYLVRAFDSCGEGTARSFVLAPLSPNINIGDGLVVFNSCDTFYLSTILTSGTGNIIAYPISAVLTVTPPTGPPVVYNYSGLLTSPTQIITAYFTQLYTYDLVVTDRCGNVYFRNDMPIVVTLDPQVNLNLGVVGCNGTKLLVTTSGGMVNPVTVNFSSVPAGFNPIAYNPNHPGPFVTGGSAPITYYNPTTPIPEGNYVVVLTDACGNTATNSISISNTPNPPAAVHVDRRPACQIGFGSLQIYGNLLSEIVMLSAPVSYNVPMPHDYSGDMQAGGILYLGPLPAGTYVFRTVDQCGGIRITNVLIIGYSSGATTGTITENCNSFNFHLQHSTNFLATYFLQRLNPLTSQWEHPITGDVGIPPEVDSTNALEILNNSVTSNLQFTGNFRIIKRFFPYTSGIQLSDPCYELLYSFEFTGGPSIDAVYSFACENNTYDTIVITSGYGPMLYRITSKNGLPFFINNGSSEIFLGLEAAVYNFQIEDGCGNVLNSIFDISTPTLLPVTATAFCSGQNASLSVPTFPFLNYEWWEGNNPATILSISSQLAFTPFNPTIDNGTYYVHIYYGNPNSCIDYVYDYQISVDPHIPNAGVGQTIQYCKNPGMVDLFSLLSGNYDTTGTWQENSASGALNNNLWDASNVGLGNYQFTYTVMGLCGVFDESTVVIQLNEPPATPVASLGQDNTVCESQPLYLFATPIPFGTYQWTGPNGFMSNEQNPVIPIASLLNSGTYTVHAFLEGCESAMSSVEVIVYPAPDFTMSADCINSQYTVTVMAVDNSFDVSSASYVWTGPDNFTSTINPIVITDRSRGEYSVTVTSPDGCAATSQINILRTMCSVPLGVSPNNDGKNDSFDLTGFDVLKLEIFTRYGQMVYQQDNYTNQWHGQDSVGRELPDSTYFYYILMKSGEQKTGWIYVNK